MIDLGLDGKRAIVSGAGYIPGRAGHGRATALNLANAGAAVACIDWDEGRGLETVKEIEAIGGKAFFVLADMTDPAQVQRAVDEAVASLGGLDVCVDIIGKATWDRVENTSLEDWEFSILHNVTQVFLLFQAASRHMISQGTGGALVALASVDGTIAAQYHAPYGAAKAGVISLAQTFAHELGRYGIRANAVAPGNVGDGNENLPEDEYATNGINPLSPPRGTDIANAVLFLCSRLSARITGQTLIVDGGATIQALWGMNADQLDQYRKDY